MTCQHCNDEGCDPCGAVSAEDCICMTEKDYASSEQEKARLLNMIAHQLPSWLRAAGAKWLVHHSSVDAKTMTQLLTMLGRKPSDEEIKRLVEDADSRVEHLDEIALRLGLFPQFVYEAREEYQ